ncbi:LysR family transcriptional regulator [bacterium]|nr:LysR family transcriptional regulator [bacterium]
MEINQVLVFKAIIEKGSIQKAAASMHKTQPALSAALKTLEEDLGFKLFDRSHYRLRLTPKGHRFWEGLQEFTEAHKSVLQLADSLREQEVTRLEIAIDSAAPFGNIIPPLQQALETFPFTRLNLRFGLLEQSMTALENGEVELAITPSPPIHPSWDRHYLMSRRLVSMIPKCLMPKSRKLDTAYLRSIPNIVVSTNSTTDPFVRGGLPGGQSFSVSSIAIREQLLLQGFGWGKLPEDRIQLKHIQEALLPIELEELPSVPLQFYIVWNREKKLSQSAQTAKKALIAHCEKLY